MDRQFRLARLWSNQELRRVAPLMNGLVVNVSAGTDEDKEGELYRDYFTNATAYEITNYAPGAFRGYSGKPGEHLLDLTAELPGNLKGRFDVVLNHTTLEHVFEVHAAFKNLCLLSKDIVIIIVPFAQVQHENEGYQDFWRFTPTCLRKMFAENGVCVVYEAANNDFNAATYLMVVGSRQPERWAGKFPPFNPLEKIASWIGKQQNSGSFSRRLITLPSAIGRHLRGI